MPNPQTVDRAAIQHRTLVVLTCAQVFSSLGNGSTLALGSVLAVELSGRESLAGAATTALGLGAAVSAMPLARLAVTRGRRVALGTGLCAAILGTFAMVAAVLLSSFVLVVIGSALVGVATAVNLQARFAATDLSDPAHRGRHLSVVVWAITVGAVLGPNTVVPGAALSQVLGLPTYAGAFLISAAGMVIGGTIVLVGLRPDPLLTRARLDGVTDPTRRRASVADGIRDLFAHPTALGAAIAMMGAHAGMVGVMSMTPLHLTHSLHGAHTEHVLSVIGITISLHIAGMYALSPLMGVATDRFGARPTVVAGLLGVLVAAATAASGAAHVPVVTAALVLLGLGWSAATIAGSTLLTSALPPETRVPTQGFVDAAVSLVGATAAAGAGPVMGVVDYPGVGAVVVVVSAAAAGALLALTRTRSSHQVG